MEFRQLPFYWLLLNAVERDYSVGQYAKVISDFLAMGARVFTRTAQ
jgi:hypothetical protein